MVEIKPFEFYVSAPYPDPFNPSTTLQYEIQVDCYIRLVIYDILGREVAVLKDGMVGAGIHEEVWNGRTDEGEVVSSGVYLYQFVSDKHTAQGKMLLMK